MPRARAMRAACAGAACRPPLRRGRADRAVALPVAGAHALNSGKPQCARVRPQAPDRRPCLLPRRVRWRDRVRHLRRHELAMRHLRRWQLASCPFPSDCFDHLSPAASEPRHDGADRHTGHLRYLPISEPLDIAQYQGFPVGRWQFRDSSFERCRFGFSDQRRLRGPATQIRCGDLLALQLSEIIDDHKCRGTVVLQPSVSRISHDCQKPCARIAFCDIRDRAKCAQARVLHYVLGIRPVRCNPTCQRVSITQMRKHKPCETLMVILVSAHSASSPSWLTENDKETGIVPCYSHSLSEISCGAEVTTSRSNLAGKQKRRRAVYVCRI